jgi:C4-dicarboxylate-specific signal transduction histidine kinase
MMRKCGKISMKGLSKLEQDFAHLNRLTMMGELAASLAHEITQPIAAARNNARAALNFLNRKPPDLDEVEEALGCVVDDADRAGAIIDRIRDHIKKAPPRTAHFDINGTVREVVELGRSAIENSNVSIQMQLAEGLPRIRGDRVQMQQVILNLILNAVEAMATIDNGRRELLISTENENRSDVVVVVRDTGPGIEQKRRERIFDAFYTTKSNGIGMGLWICRSIVSAHGGALWMEAIEPRGAVFKILLPRAEMHL